MPLPNRVDPFGNLFGDDSRGLLFGNRGGRFHRDGQTLGARRWVSRRWICCRLDFKGRHRDVWGRGYTELFFLDEPTALAAGHRPCFECRRADARAFAAAFARGHAMSADEIDRVLHAQRLDGRAKRGHRRALDGLPAAAFSPWRTSPAAPGPSAALRCCNGHPADTPRRMRVRAILWLTFSHRPALWPRWRAAIDHAGIRARMRGRFSQRQVTLACGALRICSR
jgi:hypothetical protein